jgi:F0F1-type ATP synthase membrane subunit b/b'
MIHDAHRKIETDIHAAREAMRSELVTLVAEATEAVIDQKLDSSKDTALIERSLREVER